MLDLSLCSQSCTGCIRGYKKKHTLQRGDTFDVNCEGILDLSKNLPIYQGLDEDEKDTAKSLLDPVKWAAETLDWHCLDLDGEIWKRKNSQEYYKWIEEHPGESIVGKSRYHRPYQAELLRCTSKRKVSRIGRQCITGDQYVYTPKGPKLVSSLEESQTILGGTVNFLDKHLDTIYEIRFDNGTSLKVNSEHPFYTQDGWKETKDLTITDKVQFLPSSNMIVDKSTLVEDNQAKLLGYLLSDGYWGFEESVKFTNNNSLFLEEVSQLVKQFFPEVSPKCRAKGNGFDFHLTQKHRTSKHNPIDNYLKELGIYGKDTFGSLLTMSDSAIKSFISGYFNGDGYLWHYKRPTRKGYRSEIGFAIGLSRQKAYEFQYLLWRLGIHAIVKNEVMIKSTAPFFRVLVSRRTDQLKLLEFLDTKKYPEKFQDHTLCLLEGRGREYGSFSQIKSIRLIGKDYVYGWETTSGEIISTCGMRTHNSGKTEALVISILFHMFVKPDLPEDEGFQVIVVAPYQVQIDLVFTRAMQLISTSPLTQNSIKRHVKAPIYTLELHNGSIVRGFTAGTQSGSNAKAVRGQHGHMLILDECDYLSSGDIETVLNIITNYPNATVWMSSTPTGKRERFYHTCHSKLWKEFHYPSSVNPMWDTKQERLFREQMTEITYKHEILADFGEQEEGVFQNSYVQAARKPYAYGDIPRRPSCLYSIGVDWNDVKNGTTICVTSHDTSTGLFTVVQQAIVSRAGWTQLDACQKIAEYNRTWKPFAIYIDMGYGGAQYEVLRKFGFDSMLDPQKGPNHPDSKLRDIVHQYDFGSKLEIHDLFTKEPVMKPAKPFLVENAVRRFETGDIVFSEYDTKLESQLQNYIIDHVSQTGLPVYRPNEDGIGDHMLDALMLSLIAFTLEKTAFGKPNYDTGISFSGYFGDKKNSIDETASLIIKSDNKDSNRDRQKPEMNRTSTIEQKSLLSSNSLPASHVQGDNSVGLWSWPGFGSDKPRPKIRTLAEAGRDAAKRLGLSSRSTCRPRRKNI